MTRSVGDRVVRAVAGFISAHPVVTIVGLIVVVLAIVTTPGGHHPPSATVTTPPARAARTGSQDVARTQGPGRRPVEAVAPPPAPVLWPPAAGDAARLFLNGYVSYTYGQLAVSRIPAASAALRASIASHRPRVPGAIHRLHPRVTRLLVEPARVEGAGAGWAASATVTDGLESYPVAVKLGRADGRWVVTALLPPP